MTDLILVTFGTPEHGWLPLDFHYNDFGLDFDASDVLNDSIEELYNVITKLQNNEQRRITWWLEPGAYFFDFERKDEKYTLTIIDTGDLLNKNEKKVVLTTITGDRKKIIEPFRIALKQFISQSYEETHWPFSLDKNKIENL
jgi:hypothetical protein